MEATTRAPWVSGREAASILSDIGLPRETARRALLTGIAGPGQPHRGAVLYDAAAVQALIRPALTEEDLPDQLKSGAFIGRVGPPGTAKGLDLTQPAANQRMTVAGPWRISWQTGLVIWARDLRDWPMPFVATVAGIAVLGAHIVGTRRVRSQIHLILEEPGGWYEEIRNRRLPITPRGAPWTMIPSGTLLAPGFGPRPTDSLADPPA